MKNIAFILLACLLSFTTFAQKKTATTKTKTTTAKSKTAVATKKADPEAQKKIDEATAAFDKELQATWKLNEMTVDGTYINATKKIMTIPEETEKLLTAEQRKTFDSQKPMYITKASASSVTFNGKDIAYIINNTPKKGTYTLKPKGDSYVADIVLSDGTKETMDIVSVKNNMLSVVQTIKTYKAEMVFVKIVPRK